MTTNSEQQTRPVLDQTAWRLIALAFGLSCVMGVELAAGTGFLRAAMAGDLPWQSAALVLAMVLMSTFAIMNAFNATLRPDPTRIASTIASVCLAMVAGVEASHHVSPLPLLFYFLTSLVAHAVFALCVTHVFVAGLRLAGHWVAQPPLYAAGVVICAGIIGIVSQSWISLETMTQKLPLFRDLALIAIPLTVLLSCGFHPPIRLDHKSWRNSITMRLPFGKERTTQRRALILMSFGTVASLLGNLTAHLLGTHNGTQALGVLSGAWLGVAYIVFSELAAFTGEQKHGQVSAKLAPTSAKRFLKRHLAESSTWAATVGLKTTNFHIDHDPGGFLENHLPASIMQIRAEEIQRCVNDVLGDIHLHSHVVGHRIFGAVDPETAMRPCVDALKMFACLYLDAGPLVERRLKGLGNLLPIVDPGLARVLKPTDVGQLIRRNQWFFHFDFGWIDQHVIHTPRNTRYDVRMSTLQSRVRDTMLTYLEKTGGVGNFVWLGPEARDRLLQEAPALKNVIEACPVPMPEGDELLMFIIKFEQLIPRLQRYFDLDTMRRTLADFEPSPESARLQNLIGLQVSRARGEAEILDIVSQITSVPWRGFKEKDAALQLILRAYQGLSEQLTPGHTLLESNDPKHRALHERLLESVRSIGYPSQLLHNAQVSKIAMRDAHALRGVAFDPASPRFQEAWLLLATADYARQSLTQRSELLALLSAAANTIALAEDRLVQVKTCDALASIARVATAEERPALRKTLNDVASWLAKHAVDPDVMCLLLDTQVFTESVATHDMSFDAAVSAALGRYVASAQAELGPDHPLVIALLSRWQELCARVRTADAA